MVKRNKIRNGHFAPKNDGVLSNRDELTTNDAIRRELAVIGEGETNLARAQKLAAEYPDDSDVQIHVTNLTEELLRHYRLYTYLRETYWESNVARDRGRKENTRDAKIVAEVWRLNDLGMPPKDITDTLRTNRVGIELRTVYRILETRPK